MNKKGVIVLRDMIFMVIIFGGLMALMSLFVFDLAGEYSNTAMNEEFIASGVSSVGNDISESIDGNVSSMYSDVEETTGFVGAVVTSIKGVGSILKTVITLPISIKTALSSMLVALSIPNDMALIISNIIMLLIFVTITFVIVSAVLRGGKV